MRIPSEFLEKMEKLLGGPEYGEFAGSYTMPRHYGLRVNTLKIPVGDFLELSPFRLEPVPWTVDGFYYEEGMNPGRHPYYHAGLYYIQEPSAMLPGSLLGARPGERVLDICAAPGGKTVQIAAGMKGHGLLVANDINQDRVKALVKNIELCGVRNAIVLNESPEKLAGSFPGYFDRILVDAPCSGEGMFRKDEDAARSWHNYKCETCSGLQRDILQYADLMLKPGGLIVYSTCTFSPEEDENVISQFLENHMGYELGSIPKVGGIESGRPEWSGGDARMAGTARLWPHRVKGEGHFAAVLLKGNGRHDSRETGDNVPAGLKDITVKTGREKDHVTKNAGSGGSDALEAFSRFAEENLNIVPNGYFMNKGKNLYLLPEEPPSLDGLKVSKFGWFMGEFENGRFEPSHSLVTALSQADVKRTLTLTSDSREVQSYLKGETLMLDGENGLTAVCVDGYTLGWAKQAGGTVKNLYPKGWRRMS